MSDSRDELIALAAAMRAAQIAYFTGGRTAAARDQAIKLERQWDRQYKRYCSLAGQLEMFGDVRGKPGDWVPTATTATTGPHPLPGQLDLFDDTSDGEGGR